MKERKELAVMLAVGTFAYYTPKGPMKAFAVI
jgi:hypothetical protein